MQSKEITADTVSIKAFDVLFLADVTRHGDVGFRIRREIEACVRLGCRVAIKHVQSDALAGSVSPDIQHCIRNGLAEVVPDNETISVKMVLVFSPGRFENPKFDSRYIRADRVVLIVDTLPSLQQMGQWHTFSFGEMSWAPTNRWIRSALAAFSMPVPLEEEDWRPVVTDLERQDPSRKPGSTMVIGRLSMPGQFQWPNTKEELKNTYSLSSEFEFLYSGAPPRDLIEEIQTGENWREFSTKDISVERFVGFLDAFAYFPSRDIPELPDAAIAEAMASGKPVFLPKRFEPHFGPGATYVETPDFKPMLAGLTDAEEAFRSLGAAAQKNCAFQFPEAAYSDKIDRFLGDEKGSRHRRDTRKKKDSRVLFVPSNGIGMGHVSRLLAIATRLGEGTEAVFASLAQASELIEATGFHSEYIPSVHDSRQNLEVWDRWFRYELDRLIDRYDANTVVFDGNIPTTGLLGATLSRADCKLVWVRRGMQGPTNAEDLDKAKFIDLVIEPGEIAPDEANDLSTLLRGETLSVGPITLLDRKDLLSRETARKDLQLSEEHPAVLVQLGVGSNRDNVSLVEKVVRELKKIPNPQIVLAEWKHGTEGLPRLPGCRIVQAFPLSRYFNAFDFSVSAAGYNTFHEVIRFGLPTVFVPNVHPQLDDQWARAQYAQDKQAGFNLPEDEIENLAVLGEALLKPEIRNFMRANSLGLSSSSGAVAAAVAIEKQAAGS